jgi:restriction system protein
MLPQTLYLGLQLNVVTFGLPRFVGMPVWQHAYVSEPPELGETLGARCRFCRTDLRWKNMPDLWPRTLEEIDRIHKEEIHSMAETHGDFILENLEIQHVDELATEYGCCPVCGWWLISKQVVLTTRKQLWIVQYGTAGELRPLDLNDISVPIDEIRSYLCARYDFRYHVNPRKFEDVVGNVFSSLGYKACVTAYSGDGGIDVVLQNDEEKLIGVQVKRHKNSIQVEQIRAFLGALVLSGHTEGLFITTSKFQSGASECARLADHHGVLIDLVDADEFLKMLKVAQLADFNGSPSFLESNSLEKVPELAFVFEMHMNSL